MRAGSVSLEPGSELLLVTEEGVVVGRAVIERVLGSADVVARLSLFDQSPRCEEVELLRELAEASESLAFAAMNEIEARLRGVGIQFRVPSLGLTLLLGRDCDGIVITERERRIAFHLTASSSG